MLTTCAPSAAPPIASDHRRLYCIATDGPIAGDRVVARARDTREAEPATAEAAADSLGMPQPHVCVRVPLLYVHEYDARREV